MARISTYQRDTVVTKNDKVIGTDSSGSITKNFKLEDIAGFFSNTNAIGTVTQLNFKFVTQGRDTQTISFDALGGNNTSFGSVTSLVFSTIDADGNNIGNYLNQLVGKTLVFARLDDFSNFAVFDVITIADHPTESNFKIFTLNNRANYGSLIEDKYYGIGLFPIDTADKHTSLVFTSASFAASTEVINGSAMRYLDFTHNLNKYPAITATEAGSEDQVAYVPIKYINTNTVRVYFTGLTNGIIYAN